MTGLAAGRPPSAADRTGLLSKRNRARRLAGRRLPKTVSLITPPKPNQGLRNRFEGGGYPNGLRGAEINDIARLATIEIHTALV